MHTPHTKTPRTSTNRLRPVRRSAHRSVLDFPCRRPRGWLIALLLSAACLAPTVALTAASPPPVSASVLSAVSFPNTPAGQQATWLVGAIRQGPLTAAEVKAHFDKTVIAALAAPAAESLNATFAGVKTVSVDSISTSTPAVIAFVVTVNGTSKLRFTLAVDSHGLISGFHEGAAPATTPTLVPSVPDVRQIPVGVGSPPLKGTLTLPVGKGPFPAVVLVSGSGPNDQNETVGPNHPFLDIAAGLAERGIATLRYDKRTLDYPKSFNPATYTPVTEYVPDALAAIRLLQHNSAVDPHEIFVLGHSEGGRYAPLIAKQAPALAGVIVAAGDTETVGQATLRQLHYLETLPGKEGAIAKAQLPAFTKVAAVINNEARLEKLEKTSPKTVVYDGAGPAYWLSDLRYNPVATARSLRQPLLFLQGDRDYQVTVKNDLDVWLAGLKGKKGVMSVQFPKADHLFLDGTGRPTPADYAKAGHVDPKVIASVATWVDKVDKG